MNNPWERFREIAEKAKAFLPRGSRQKEIDRAIREWKAKDLDKHHDLVPPLIK